MNLASLVVHTRPENMEAVRTRLLDLVGVEIHGAHPQGRLVVTVEDDDEARLADTLLRIHREDGVVAAALVYAQREPTSDPRESP
ncbi:MAG TPA: chaperone NapD [Methylococcaceae bacterium]|nr:chaperone NapD [Methylococcaceae bacterium]